MAASKYKGQRLFGEICCPPIARTLSSVVAFVWMAGVAVVVGITGRLVRMTGALEDARPTFVASTLSRERGAGCITGVGIDG